MNSSLHIPRNGVKSQPLNLSRSHPFLSLSWAAVLWELLPLADVQWHWRFGAIWLACAAVLIIICLAECSSQAFRAKAPLPSASMIYMCVRGLCKLVFLHLRVECSWLGHLNLAACTIPHHARLHNQPKNFQTFAFMARYHTNQSNSWGSCRDMVSLGFRDGGVWITVGDCPFLYPNPLFFSASLSLSLFIPPPGSVQAGVQQDHHLDTSLTYGQLLGN